MSDDARPGNAGAAADDDATEGTQEPNWPGLMSTAEVAALVDRTPRTIRDWARTGLLTRHRVGRAVFFFEHEVMKMLLGM